MVTNTTTDTDRISFTVDQVGTPILIRSSFFPAWKANGAEGPFRVAPNFMVVVPTQEDVELVFSRTTVDIVALLLTALGIATIAALATAPLRRRSRANPRTDEIAPGPMEPVPLPETELLEV